MDEGSVETRDPRSAMETSLRFAIKEFLENCDDYKLFKLTKFYRDRLEQAIEEEVESISFMLKMQHFSEQEHLKVVEKGNQAHRSKLLLTLVMEKGSSARRAMWESFVQIKNSLPKLERVFKEIQQFSPDPEFYRMLNQSIIEVPSELKDVQQKHKDLLREQTEKLIMSTIKKKDAEKVFQLVDRYAELTVISSVRDWKLVEHELLVRGQEHEEWREKHVQREMEIIGTDKLFCSSFCQRKLRPGSSAAVSGIPGIGKTTMVQKIVYDWATGKIYHNFHFVFSFKFRELNVINCRINLSELVLDQYPYFGKILKEVWKNPEQILFIFDGLDEYNVRIDFADNRQNTEPKHMCSDPEAWCKVSDIVYALIQGKLLPGCSVLLTSRPTALHLLERAEISVWAEILGFAREERKEYFNRFFEDQTVAAAVFKYMEENKILYTMSFNPSYCWILGQTLGPFFIKKGKKMQRIPKTITELYSYHIYNILKNHSCRIEKPRDILLKIGEMAFSGVSEKNIMFRDGDLIKYDLKPSQFLSGFLMELLQRDDSAQSVVYAFMHLTVQEFVAALARFLNADTEGIQKFFKEAYKEEDGRYELLLRFVCGLSSRSYQPLVEFLGPFSYQTSYNVIDWIKEEVQKQIARTGTKACKRRLLNMFHFLFESQNSPLAQSTVGSVKKLTFSGLQLNPIDCAVLSNVIGFCDAIKDLDLLNCSIRCDGLQWLVPELHKCEVLRLDNNKLGDSGVKLLAAALKEPKCQIQKLQLSANNLTVSCTEDLCSALSENRSLLELDLSNNKLGDSGMKNLSMVLKKQGCKIQTLRLKANSLTASCAKDLSNALSINQSLTALCLGSNEFGDAGVRQLSKALKKVNELWLEDNNLSDSCIEDLASTVSAYQSLNLSCNQLGDSGMKALSVPLKKPGQKLEELRLYRVGLTAACASDIACVLSINCSLMVLDLGGNKLGDQGIRLLCEALRKGHSKIQKLQFWENDLTDSCTEDLCSGLCTVTSLQMLNLKSNFFTDQSADTFYKFVLKCSRLKMINLDENKFSSKGHDRLLSLREFRNGMRVIV